MVAQDGSGWTPLMIAASVKDGEDLVDLLLRKDADVNAKSESPVRPSRASINSLFPKS